MNERFRCNWRMLGPGEWRFGHWREGKATHISQHMVQARRLWSGATCAIGARVFCFLLLEMEEKLVVGEKRGLGVDDLGLLLVYETNVDTRDHVYE